MSVEIDRLANSYRKTDHLRSATSTGRAVLEHHACRPSAFTASCRVVIIQQFVPQYRVAFFEALRARLATSGVELILIHGQPSEAEAAKHDSVEIGWAQRVQNRTFSIRGRSLLWQPVLKYLQRGDLVIVEQATRLLVNPVLIARHLKGQLRVAFWGHGRDLTSNKPNRFGEAIKRWLSRRVHWWFAYTAGSARIVANLAFPVHRVTIVQNAFDTGELASARAAVSMTDTQRLRDSLGIYSKNVAIYCGALYHEKRLEFLLQAAEAIRERVSDFELLVLGAGRDRGIVEQTAATRSWVHHVGPKFGADKAQYFGLAQVMLLPGLVGLGILDSFVFQTPLVAIGGRGHAPEIEYLEDGRNGLLLPPGCTPQQYADAVAELLRDEEHRGRLASGCQASTERYTLANMVERFATGIEEAIATPRYDARTAPAGVSQ